MRLHHVYYVYYRVPETRLAEALVAVRSVHAALGAAVELLRRPGHANGLVTLMEVYQLEDDAAQAFEASAAAALAPWLDGPRHIEVFEAVA